MQQNPRGNSALGYLAAFTLGMVCMGLVIIVTRENAQSLSQLPDHTSRRDDSPADPLPPPPPITFAQRAALSATSSQESIRRKVHSLAPAFAREGAMQLTNTASAPEIPAGQAPSVPITPRAEILPSLPFVGIRGRVFLQGQPPPEKPMPLDPPCAAQYRQPPTTRFFLVGKDNGLADVVIYVLDGLPRQAWQIPNQPLIISQQACSYEPYIAAARVGQPIWLQNLEADLMHNVHLTPMNPLNRELNLALLPKSKPITIVTAAPELHMRLKCDVHPWEFSYISLFDHPYFAVSDLNGEFLLPMLPPGEYVLEANHRKAGIIQQQLTVTAASHHPSRLEFYFNAPAEVQARAD